MTRNQARTSFLNLLPFFKALCLGGILLQSVSSRADSNDRVRILCLCLDHFSADKCLGIIGLFSFSLFFLLVSQIFKHEDNRLSIKIFY